MRDGPADLDSYKRSRTVEIVTFRVDPLVEEQQQEPIYNHEVSGRFEDLIQ